MFAPQSGEASPMTGSSGINGDVGVNFGCGFSTHHDFYESSTCFSDIDDPNYADVGGDSDSNGMHSGGDTSLVVMVVVIVVLV